MRMHLFLLGILCTSAALAAPERIGLYPLALPLGQEQLGDRLASQLQDGAAALPGVQKFQLVSDSACGPDEASCLGAAARNAGLQAVISALVTATDSGYKFHLREVSDSGSVLAEKDGAVRGGPLDLGGALEHGVCELMGAKPCNGELRVMGDSSGAHLFVDGTDRGVPPLSIRLPVGRHAVKLGDSQGRVRVAYARTTHLAAELQQGAPALADEAGAASTGGDVTPAAEVTQPQAQAVEQPASVPSEALSTAPVTADGPRLAASRVLLISGLGLLGAAGGVGLYSGTSGASGSHNARYAAAALAATGAGALVASGVIFALTPSGASIQGEF